MRIYMNVKYKDMHIHNKIKSVNSEKNKTGFIVSCTTAVAETRLVHPTKGVGGGACMLPMAVARSSSWRCDTLRTSGLWTTSCLHVMARNTRREKCIYSK